MDVLSENSTINIVKTNPFSINQNGVKLYGKLNNNRISYTIDTGASRSCLNMKYLPPNYQLKPYFGQLTAANKSLLLTLGIATCNVNIFDLNIATDFIVVEGVDFACILGNDFLLRGQIKICFDSMTLSQGDQMEKFNLNNITEMTQNSLNFEDLPHCHDDLEHSDFILYSAEDITLHPSHAQYISIKTYDNIPNGPLVVKFTEKLQSNLINKDLNFLTTWYNELNNTLYIKNDSLFVQTVKQNQKVAFAFVPVTIEQADFTQTEPQNFFSPSTIEHSIKYIYDVNTSKFDKLFHVEEIIPSIPHSTEELDICTTLEEEQKFQLKSLLHEYSDIIYWTTADYSLANVKPVSFKLKDDTPPFREKAFRYSYREKAAIEKLIHELLSCGILEHSESSFSSNFFVVLKKDGTLRPVADLRKLNKSIDYITFPTPFIDELLYFMQSSRVFSTCDLASAFYTIPIATECRPYTAVQTHIGHFQFTVLPQGLAVSPSLFQRVMYENFNYLIPKSLVIYFDDACIHAPDFPTMIENLRTFFQKLRTLNIKIKHNKNVISHTAKFHSWVFKLVKMEFLHVQEKLR
jgi:hypothetical protein